MQGKLKYVAIATVVLMVIFSSVKFMGKRAKDAGSGKVTIPKSTLAPPSQVEKIPLKKITPEVKVAKIENMVYMAPKEAKLEDKSLNDLVSLEQLSREKKCSNEKEKAFCSTLRSERFQGVVESGKQIVFYFENDHYLSQSEFYVPALDVPPAPKVDPLTIKNNDLVDDPEVERMKKERSVKIRQTAGALVLQDIIRKGPDLEALKGYTIMVVGLQNMSSARGAPTFALKCTQSGLRELMDNRDLISSETLKRQKFDYTKFCSLL